MEEFFVQGLIGILAPHGEENVPTNELVDDFAIRGEAIENDALVIVERCHHVLGFPINVPCLKNENKFL